MEHEENEELKNPGNKWCLSADESQRVVQILRSSYDNKTENVIINLPDYSFNFIYSQTLRKLTVERPRTSNYMEILSDKNQEEMTKQICWIVLYDMCYYKCVPNDIMLMHKNVYDSLSLRFHDFRSKTYKFEITTNENLIYFFSAAVEAVVFQVAYALFPECHSFNKNDNYVSFVDATVRGLLIGFVSSASSFQSLVWTILSLKLQKTIQKVINRRLRAEDFNVGDSIGAEVAVGFAEEHRFENAKKEGKSILFYDNTKTSLIENALKLKGMRTPTKEKTRFYRHGIADRSRISLTKVRALKRERSKLIDTHIDKRDTVLFDICSKEAECVNKIRKYKLRPLSFSFETFGYDTLKGQLDLTVPQSARVNLKQGVWKDFTRIKEVPKENPPAEKFIEQIQKNHENMELFYYPTLPTFV